MNSKDLGNTAELAAAKKLKSLGHTVSFPFGDNARYDLIFDDSSELVRAQIRKASKRDNYLVFKCYSNHRKNGEIVRDSFQDVEIDCFLVWYQKQDRVYKIPVSETPKTEMRLRLEDTKNNQQKNVNYAENYLLK